MIWPSEQNGGLSTPPRRLNLSVLDMVNRKLIHQSALDILEQVGVMITHAAVRELLLTAGCREGNKEAMLIPPKLVEQALADTSAGIALYTRDGDPVVELGADTYCLLAALHVVYLVDDETGLRCSISYEDACEYARLMNQLDHLDVVGAWTISDRPPNIADRYSAHAVICNSAKPFYLAPLSMAGMQDVHQMCTAVVGGDEALAEKPFWITSATGIPPLRFPDFSLDRLLFTAERGIPVVVAPVEMAGASSPIDLCGTLALLVANNLAGITIGQLHRPGSPLIMGGVGATMDMRTGLMNYAGPEFNLLCSGLAEMGRHYNLPVWGTGGCTSAKLFDTQAAAEMTSSLIFAILSGGHLIHDVGFLDNGLATSYQTLLFCNEIASFMRRAGKRLSAGSAESVMAQIKRAGVDGSYLTSPETMQNFRGLWDSPLMERRSYENWDGDGRPDLNHRLGCRVKQLLERSQPDALNPQQQKVLDHILKACTAGGSTG
ncbi:MAG: trimethylamine methyltransferase family protein [Thermodesulfobacteriota bacterium]